MKLEVNISKKHMFFLAIFASILLIGVVYAANPNPGHGPEQIGPGQFNGGANDFWIFPGKINMIGAVPQIFWSSTNPQEPLGYSLFRVAASKTLFKVDYSTSGTFGTFDTLLSIDAASKTVNLADSVFTEGFVGINDAVTWSYGGRDMLSLYEDSVGGKATVLVRESLQSPEVCLGAECRNNWSVQFSSMPVGSWCGWQQGNTKIKCGDMDLLQGCPSVPGKYNFQRMSLQNQFGEIFVCVRTA